MSDALAVLHTIDESELTQYYCSNIHNIQQFDKSTIISTLAGKGERATHALRNYLINELIKYFPDYSARTANTRANIEDICKDIHTLSHCYVQNTEYNLGSVFQSIDTPPAADAVHDQICQPQQQDPLQRQILRHYS